MKHVISLIFLLITSLNSWGGEVRITAVSIKQQSPEHYQFNVTLKHQDTGWEHYADAWRIVDEQGNILATRTLFHPHVNEQPFTRSLNRVKLDEHLNTLYIEAHDTVHGWSKNRLRIRLSDLQNGQLTIQLP